MGIRNHKIIIGSLGALAFIGSLGSSYGNQPPDTVSSDAGKNTAMGTNALLNITGQGVGTSNTAAGYDALENSTSPTANVAIGAYAIAQGGNDVENDVAVGFEALMKDAGGSNTAVGYDSLLNNASGTANTAMGYETLAINTTGSYNTADGLYALVGNQTGEQNTASGAYALYANNGSWNTATGYQSLFRNTTGYKNAADGFEAMYSNSTGFINSAFGLSALYYNTTGSYNIGLGWHGGYNLTTGSYNIDIGNAGNAGESGIIRLGTAGEQTAAYVAGVSTMQITGAPVYVTASGQLGVLASSERYKTAIAPIGPEAERVQQLRPVSFHLKTDPAGAVQYGLIAEEVDKIYPELVIRDDKGIIQGVRYDELAPMLLREVQQQQAALSDQKTQLQRQADELTAMHQQLNQAMRLNLAMRTVVQKLQTRERRVAMR